MAKVKAPLFSFKAQGKLADSLVYFGWKGLNVIRSWVVPANPKTDAQTTQRGYLSDAVAGIHEAEANVDVPLSAADKTGYALLGSLQPTPRTWFNTLCKIIIDQLVAGKDWTIFGGMEVAPGADKLTVTGFGIAYGTVAATDGKLYYGTSKSALASSIDCTVAELTAGKEITSLVTGTKYYVQYRPDTPAGQVGSNSGIHYGTPT
jgi:hypothetical protein